MGFLDGLFRKKTQATVGRTPAKRIAAEAVARAVVDGIVASSAEAFSQLQTAIARESLSPGVIPFLPDSAGREFCVMLFMLTNEAVANHFAKDMVARLNELSFSHMAESLDLSPEALRSWYLQYAKPYRVDLSVPTDPFTPFGFLGVFGKRAGFPPERIPGISEELYVQLTRRIFDRSNLGGVRWDMEDGQGALRGRRLTNHPAGILTPRSSGQPRAAPLFDHGRWTASSYSRRRYHE